MTNEYTPKRKPGGQPNNRNALKHGLRSRKATPLEMEQSRIRVLLVALEQAARGLERELAELDRQHALGIKKPFVGLETAPGGFRFSRPGEAFRPCVFVEPSRDPGLLVVKAAVIVPAVLLSAPFQPPASFDEIALSEHSTNDSGLVDA